MHCATPGMRSLTAVFAATETLKLCSCTPHAHGPDKPTANSVYTSGDAVPAPTLTALVTPVGSCTTATLTASVAASNGGCAVPSHLAPAVRRVPGRPEGTLTLGLLKQSKESILS